MVWNFNNKHHIQTLIINTSGTYRFGVWDAQEQNGEGIFCWLNVLYKSKKYTVLGDRSL